MTFRDVSKTAGLLTEARLDYEQGRMDASRDKLRCALLSSPDSPQTRELVRALFPDLLQEHGREHHLSKKVDSAWSDELDLDVESEGKIYISAWSGQSLDAAVCGHAWDLAPQGSLGVEPALQVEAASAPGLELLRRARQPTFVEGAEDSPGTRHHQVEAERASGKGRLADEVETILEGAMELYELGHFSSSLELVEKALRIMPGHLEARKYLKLNEDTLVTMYESKLGNRDRPLAVALAPDEVMWLSLDQKAGFLLSQIHAGITVGEVYAVSGMSRVETGRILVQLLDEGVIELG